MSIRGLHGVSQLDVTGGVKLAVKLIVRTGLVEQLQPPMDARQAKGRPNQYPNYTVLAVLATWFHLMYRGLPATVANILRCLWVDYTPEQLVMLGLPKDWRDPDRLQSMQALPAVHEQEYNRLHKFIVEMTDPIDDTPFPANRNITWAEIRRALAENTERLQPKTDLRMAAMNDIVAASVPVELFGNYQGHVATDEHMVVICPDPRETPTAAHKKKLGPPAASYWPKSLRFDGAAVIGLTLAIAVSEPGQPAIPTGIALGMATGPALAADIPGALISIDAADRHPVMSKASKSIWRFVIGDKAYPYGKGFVAALNDRGRYMLGDFRVGQPHVLPLWASPEDTDCPKLASGCIVCPGIPQATLEAADPRQHEQYDTMSPAQLKAVQDRYDYIEAGRMPTNGRPKRSVKRKARTPQQDH